MSHGEGSVIGGRYRLVTPIGRGGMGVVWRAHDEVLDRDVAVKEVLFPPGLTAEERQILYTRTLREARSAARLSHPGIVTVHDVVEEDGRPWIVMELIRARSLQEIIDADGPLPAAQVAEIGRQVLGALTAAHTGGILHRDIKPSNVLLAGDRAVITDFGIAVMEGDSTLTQTGLVMGSPAYIAPERVKGDKAQPASDLWSAGATLYAAVEGRAPHDRPEAMAALAAVLTEEAPPPRRAGPLTPVLMGLLAHEPAHRISAAQAVEGITQAQRMTFTEQPDPPQNRVPRPQAPWPTEHAGAPQGPNDDRVFRAGSPPTPNDDHTFRAGSPPGSNDDRTLHAGPGNGQAPSGPGWSSDDRTLHAGSRDDQTLVEPPSFTLPPIRYEAPAHRSRRPVLLTVVAVLVLVAVGVAAFFLWPEKAGSQPDPKVSSSPPPAPQQPSVPAGYHRDNGPAGSTVAVPNGWKRSDSDSRSVLWSDPVSGAYLQIDTRDWKTSDPVEHWKRFVNETRKKKQMRGFAPKSPSAPFAWRGGSASDLSFSWTSNSGTVYGFDRGVSVGDTDFALYASVPSNLVTRMAKRRQVFYDTFQP